MKNRKVLFTEEQMRYIFSENKYGVYNGEQMYSSLPSDVSSEVGDSEVSPETYTDLDKVGNERCANTNVWRAGTPKRRFLEEYAKKKINEQNRDMVRKKVVVPDYITAQLPDGKLKKNLMSNPNMPVNTADQNIFRTNDSENQGLQTLNSFLKSQVGNKRQTDKTLKDISRKNGKSNTFLKKHKKTSGNGSAHSKKDNPISFTYEY